MTDWEVVACGRVNSLREALESILSTDSCLLAEAQDIARKALEEDDERELARTGTMVS